MKKSFSIREYIIKVLNGMAWGLFASLLIGTIIRTLGQVLDLPLLVSFGTMAMQMMSPAIGVGVAYVLKAPALVVMSAVACGAMGGGALQIAESGITIRIGEPVGAFVAALGAVEVGRRVAGKTPVDILLVPLVTVLVGGLLGKFVSPVMSEVMTGLGQVINRATELQPVPMGIAVSVLMGIILTLPISSAALAVSLNLSGLAAGAATVGCCCNMIGFAVASYKDNGFGGSLAQGIGTSMLQIPNIVKKPAIWLPAIVASAVLGPLSSAVLGMTSNATGAGMGTSGLVGQFAQVSVMGTSPSVLFQIALMHFILPGLIAGLVASFMRKRGWIRPGDMTLQTE